MASLLSKEPVCRKEDCSLIDIGTVYRVISSFTDTEKFWFIESVWKPDLLFEFPASKETSGNPGHVICHAQFWITSRQK